MMLSVVQGQRNEPSKKEFGYGLRYKPLGKTSNIWEIDFYYFFAIDFRAR